MNKKLKSIVFALSTVLGVGLLTGCNKNKENDNNKTNNGEHEHVFENYVSDNNATCKKDGTKTSKCTYCDKKSTIPDAGSQRTEHSFTNYLPNNDASCGKNATETACCNYCNSLNTRAIEGTMLEHDFSSTAISDRVLASQPTCTEPAKCYYACKKCGAIGTETYEIGSPLGHDFTVKNTDSKYLVDVGRCDSPATYYYSCSRCGESSNVDTFETGVRGHSFTNYVSDGNATCTQDGTKTAKCDRCFEKDTIPDVGSAGHSYKDEWSYNEEKHWHDAACGHETTSGEAAHQFSESILNEATCTEQGNKKYTCDCGYSYEEAIGVLDHTFDVKNTDSKYLVSAATCQTPATYYYSCACGATGTETFNVGGLAAHKYGDPIIVEPTIQTNGLKTYTCTVCGNMYTEIISNDYLVFTEKIIDDDFLRTPATCYEAATYYYSDGKGNHGQSYFEYGSPNPHELELITNSEGKNRIVCKNCDLDTAKDYSDKADNNLSNENILDILLNSEFATVYEFAEFGYYVESYQSANLQVEFNGDLQDGVREEVNYATYNLNKQLGPDFFYHEEGQVNIYGGKIIDRYVVYYDFYSAKSVLDSLYYPSLTFKNNFGNNTYIGKDYNGSIKVEINNKQITKFDDNELYTLDESYDQLIADLNEPYYVIVEGENDYKVSAPYTDHEYGYYNNGLKPYISCAICNESSNALADYSTFDDDNLLSLQISDLLLNSTIGMWDYDGEETSGYPKFYKNGLELKIINRSRDFEWTWVKTINDNICYLETGSSDVPLSVENDPTKNLNDITDVSLLSPINIFYSLDITNPVLLATLDYKYNENDQAYVAYGSIGMESFYSKIYVNDGKISDIVLTDDDGNTKSRMYVDDFDYLPDGEFLDEFAKMVATVKTDNNYVKVYLNDPIVPTVTAPNIPYFSRIKLFKDVLTNEGIAYNGTNYLYFNSATNEYTCVSYAYYGHATNTDVNGNTVDINFGINSYTVSKPEKLEEKNVMVKYYYNINNGNIETTQMDVTYKDEENQQEIITKYKYDSVKKEFVLDGKTVTEYYFDGGYKTTEYVYNPSNQQFVIKSLEINETVDGISYYELTSYELTDINNPFIDRTVKRSSINECELSNEEMEYNYSKERLVGTSKFISEYDEDGRQTSKIVYSWDGNKDDWYISYIFEGAYNAFGTTLSRYIWFEPDGRASNFISYAQEYYDDGRTKTMTNHKYDSATSSWITTSYTTYTYADDGSMNSMGYVYSEQTKKFEPNSSTKTTYDKTNNTETTLTYLYFTSINNFELYSVVERTCDDYSSRDTYNEYYIRNENGTLKGYYVYDVWSEEHGALIRMSGKEYTYDQNGYVATCVELYNFEEDYYADLIPTLKHLYINDENGRVVVEVVTTYDANTSTYNNDYKIVYTYDESGEVSSTVRYEYDSQISDWVLC